MFTARVDGLKAEKNSAQRIVAKQLEESGRSIIDLSAGELDEPAPAVIRDAAREALGTASNRYTETIGLPLLRRQLVPTPRSYET
ncbi:hypothetical protein D8B27_20135 [Verminephrobacter aporrectodeae subsp. tuberculatae]|nr:hypothetical protein [Verminephrobacter aporrectodeae subsp. tuberculatae]MCW8209256.1 hypothetical protein [Verminephrobacter aporrectodeae subsp. tuberculatae]